MKCEICGGKEFKTKKNYPFGIRSKPRIIKICKHCKNKRYDIFGKKKQRQFKRKNKTDRR